MSAPARRQRPRRAEVHRVAVVNMAGVTVVTRVAVRPVQTSPFGVCCRGHCCWCWSWCCGCSVWVLFVWFAVALRLCCRSTLVGVIRVGGVWAIEIGVSVAVVGCMVTWRRLTCLHVFKACYIVVADGVNALLCV